jgi:hypothetical protein
MTRHAAMRRLADAPSMAVDIEAFHEAGHAVASVVLGQPLGRAALGLVTLDLRESARAWRASAQGQRVGALIALAGPCAEQRLCGYTPEQSARLWATYWKIDFRNALRHLDAIGGSGADALSEAAELVREHWDAIERVADALAERGELTGAEVEALVG